MSGRCRRSHAALDGRSRVQEVKIAFCAKAGVGFSVCGGAAGNTDTDSEAGAESPNMLKSPVRFGGLEMGRIGEMSALRGRLKPSVQNLGLGGSRFGFSSFQACPGAVIMLLSGSTTSCRSRSPATARWCPPQQFNAVPSFPSVTTSRSEVCRNRRCSMESLKVICGFQPPTWWGVRVCPTSGDFFRTPFRCRRCLSRSAQEGADCGRLDTRFCDTKGMRRCPSGEKSPWFRQSMGSETRCT